MGMPSTHQPDWHHSLVRASVVKLTDCPRTGVARGQSAKRAVSASPGSSGAVHPGPGAALAQRISGRRSLRSLRQHAGRGSHGVKAPLLPHPGRLVSFLRRAAPAPSGGLVGRRESRAAWGRGTCDAGGRRPVHSAPQASCRRSSGGPQGRRSAPAQPSAARPAQGVVGRGDAGWGSVRSGREFVAGAAPGWRLAGGSRGGRCEVEVDELRDRLRSRGARLPRASSGLQAVRSER